jgi:hypothetical protein
VLIEPTPELSQGWEIAKGVMLSLTTIGVAGLFKIMFTMRDDVRDLKKAVGTDGKNGLLAKEILLAQRLDIIDDRHLQEDTVTEIELELSEGKRRRFRDRLRPEQQEEGRQ